MKKIRLFLASSNELKADRERFEIEVYRKCKAWIDKGIFLHLDIWEDGSARMSDTRSQDEYNKMIREGDLFVLLAHTKVGGYTHEEFIVAEGKFREDKKPFIFTYFKQLPDNFDESTPDAKSLRAFQQKLKDLGHFYCHYKDLDDLWNQFNKELERLDGDGFTRNVQDAKSPQGSRNITQGDKSIYIENSGNNTFNMS